MKDDLEGAFCATEACGAVLQPACPAAAACPDANKPRSDGTSRGADPFGNDSLASAVTCAADLLALDVLPADIPCCSAS